MNNTVYDEIINILNKFAGKNILLVHSNSYNQLPLKKIIEDLNINIVYYGNVKANPEYDDIKDAVELFNEAHCEIILAAGGGSVIDTAKCVKLFSPLDKNKNYLEQSYKESSIPLIAVPTTAGSGSEATRFTVFYYKGEKQSIANDSILPDYAVLIPELLKTLPLYQKKCTFLDAFCQAIESWWSVNSTEESINYSKKAIKNLKHSMDYYFLDDENFYKLVMEGSNYAGKAINITQTTAPHAMSYKLTKLFGLPHGHSVALSLPEVLRYMSENIDKCIDPRGENYLKKVLFDIADCTGCNSIESFIAEFANILNNNQILPPENASAEDINILTDSVNTERLKNSPVFIDKNEIKSIYTNIFKRSIHNA